MRLGGLEDALRKQADVEAALDAGSGELLRRPANPRAIDFRSRALRDSSRFRVSSMPTPTPSPVRVANNIRPVPANVGAAGGVLKPQKFLGGAKGTGVQHAFPKLEGFSLKGVLSRIPK